MKRKIVAIVVGLLTFVFTAFPFIWLSLLSGQEIDREEVELHQLMRSLSNIQEQHEKYRIAQKKLTYSMVNRSFPWLPKNNTLPNYFLGGSSTHSSSSHKYYGHHYRDSGVVFLHHPRSAGTAIIDCLRDISAQRLFAMSPVMFSSNRLTWDNSALKESEFRDRIKIHRGRYAFGMCENRRVPCSYFMMLRDPLERAISSYYYCKQALGDELCSAINANKVSLRDWIISQGSLLFRQLLFHGQFCRNHINETVLGESIINKKQLPCWFKQKLHMDEVSDDVAMEAVNYIIENLDKWFAVVGFVEEFHNSIEMFEHVFKLPFSSCKSLKPKRNIVVNNNAYNYMEDNKKHRTRDDIYLQQDHFVKKALKADYRIYNKAKQLFKIQKQVLLNRLAK